MGGTDDCWIWPRGKTTAGYGVYKQKYVHRIVAEAVYGPIPDGWHVDHVYAKGCRSRACFNPRHLEVVTPAINLQRAWDVRKGEACPKGHPRTPENTRYKKGAAECAECHRVRERERSQRKGYPGRRRAELIVELLAAGKSSREVASEAGCSVSTVNRVRSGESWSRLSHPC